MQDDLAFLPIGELSPLLESGEVGAVALTELFIERAKGVGRGLNCFIALLEKSALEEARQAEARAKAGRRLGPLDGVPVALKDNIDVAGVPTSNGFGGSPWRVPKEDSEVVRRLRAAGAVILGKLNMQEGALGAASDNAHFGFVGNPYKPGHTPGGSSGGSGSALAAGLCAAALGSDTGGSIRIPAAYCGVVGLKASYGLISTRGVAPLVYGLDHVGPLARTVADAALLTAALQGFDPACTESRRRPGVGATPAAGRLDGLKLGVVRNFEQEPAQPAVAEAFRRALDRFRALGAEIRDVELPTYRLLAGRRAGFVRVEVEAALIYGEMYRAEPHRFSPTMRSYLDFGLKASAQQLAKADRVMAQAAFEYEGCFDSVDLLVSPAAPQTAFAFDRKFPDDAGTYAIVVNFAGAPALSLPMGVDAQGLPIGLQVAGPADGEDMVLRAAAAYEAAADWRLTPPAPFGPQARDKRKEAT